MPQQVGIELPDTIAELERLASDYSNPAQQIRASQRLTEITAARITNREKPFFRRLRIGSDVVLLDSHDQTELENWLAHGQALMTHGTSFTTCGHFKRSAIAKRKR